MLRDSRNTTITSPRRGGSREDSHRNLMETANMKKIAKLEVLEKACKEAG